MKFDYRASLGKRILGVYMEFPSALKHETTHMVGTFCTSHYLIMRLTGFPGTAQVQNVERQLELDAKSDVIMCDHVI